MGYYDFNEHFWAPYEVCAQKSQIVPQEEYFSIVERLHSWLRGVRHSNFSFYGFILPTLRRLVT